MPELGAVDWVLAGILLLSVAVGLWRGLVFEVLSLLGWVAAYVAAQAFGAEVAAWLPFGSPQSALNLAAGFVAVFIGVLVLWALAARLLRMLVSASPLSALDRVLGGGFGLLRGVVLLLAIATAVAFTPAVRSEAWRASHGASWLRAMIEGLKPMLPAAVAGHLGS